MVLQTIDSGPMEYTANNIMQSIVYCVQYIHNICIMVMYCERMSWLSISYYSKNFWMFIRLEVKLAESDSQKQIAVISPMIRRLCAVLLCSWPCSCSQYKERTGHSVSHILASPAHSITPSLLRGWGRVWTRLLLIEDGSVKGGDKRVGVLV